MDTGIFKAYDIRGVYPSQINEREVAKISQALAYFFKKGKVLVAYDARLSSPRLAAAVIKGLAANKKIKPVQVGFASTPMFYFLVNRLKAAGGIMVTASHNPKEWNGLKVVGKKAKMISGYEIRKKLRN